MTETAEQPLRARFLVGPTASGKTDIAQWIAERDGSEILSADSMLVYRGMDVGTAKPTAAERSRVRYHGLDLVSPGERFSAGAYRAYALDVLRRARQRGTPILVAGGTGLYVKSLTHGLAAAPDAQPELRAHWEAVSAREGVEPLRRELRRRNPRLYRELPDQANPRRLIRALELDQAGGGRLPRDWRAPAAGAPLAALRRAPAELKSRIELRVQAMYRRGLLDEVKTLRAAGGTFSGTAAQAIGYREALDVLDGICSPAQAQERTVKRTWQLARRQMTWFRHQAAVQWIDAAPDDTTETLAARVIEHWSEHGPTRIAE